MMNDPMNAFAYLTVFAVGAALGAFYFLGLWWTVRRLDSRNPAALLLLSFLLRTAVVIGGFYLIMDGRWELLLTALGGFIAARVVIVRQMRRERIE